MLKLINYEFVNEILQWERLRVATAAGVNERTVRRWAAMSPPPVHACVIAQCVVGGDLSLISNEWRGWKIGYDDRIYPSEGSFKNYGVGAGEILVTPYRLALIEELNKQVIELGGRGLMETNTNITPFALPVSLRR